MEKSQAVLMEHCRISATECVWLDVIRARILLSAGDAARAFDILDAVINAEVGGLRAAREEDEGETDNAVLHAYLFAASAAERAGHRARAVSLLMAMRQYYDGLLPSKSNDVIKRRVAEGLVRLRRDEITSAPASLE